MTYEEKEQFTAAETCREARDAAREILERRLRERRDEAQARVDELELEIALLDEQILFVETAEES